MEDYRDLFSCKLDYLVESLDIYAVILLCLSCMQFNYKVYLSYLEDN